MLKYFGTDGVRGVANQGLTPEMAFKLGRDGGYVLTKNKKDGEQAKVLVSRDTRISGQMLEYALISGLLSVGIEVLEVGVITTPVFILGSCTRCRCWCANFCFSQPS